MGDAIVIVYNTKMKVAKVGVIGSDETINAFDLRVLGISSVENNQHIVCDFNVNVRKELLNVYWKMGIR